jgi:NTP pyrophosphatase (non-canonical NTP hydrolase)
MTMRRAPMACKGVSMADNITTEVLAELERAMRKFPTWPTDPLHALAVLGEEFGELTKDVLQLTYEPHKTNAENVRKEAIQTAAMALRFAASLTRYSYLPADQHAQEAGAFGVPAVPTPKPREDKFGDPISPYYPGNRNKGGAGGVEGRKP